MFVLCTLVAVGMAGEASDIESKISVADDATQDDSAWRGGARNELYNVVGIESQLQLLGADPANAVVLSAALDWGTLVTLPAATDEDMLAFSKSGLAVRQTRLSDGQVINRADATHSSQIYRLDDPSERARLCTRMATGELSTMTLHTWSTPGLPSADQDRLRRARSLGFIVVDAVEDDTHTALVDLEPGESATLVEAVPIRIGRRDLRTRRSMQIQRDDRVIRVTESDLEQRICIEY